MAAPIIVIEISGGNMVRVLSTQPVAIVRVDRDNLAAGDEIDDIRFERPDYVGDSIDLEFASEPDLAKRISELMYASKL